MRPSRLLANHKEQEIFDRAVREGREALALSTLTANLGAHVSFDTINVAVGASVAGLLALAGSLAIRASRRRSRPRHRQGGTPGGPGPHAPA